MDYSVTFARHFSRLLWLLLNDSGAIDEQKSALRALVQVSKDGTVAFTAANWRLSVNGTPLADALTGVQDLSAQMIGHAVSELAFERGAAPADILGIARILASEPVPGDGGRAVQERLQALGATTVKLTVRPADSAPAGASAAGADGADGAAEKPSAGEPPRTIATGPPIVNDENSGRRESSGEFLVFAAQIPAMRTITALFARLDATKGVSQTTRTLDEIVTIAENANREGRADVVADAFHAIVARESEAEGDLQRTYTMAVRRMAKPTLLRAVATMMPRKRERHADYMAVLARAGEDGADALIEQLTMAQNASDRRVFFDSLIQLQAGVQALIHMLGDARWYVARNAADLLGELAAPEAEGPLASSLKHDDDRVRRAAANALAKLGTPNAMKALHDALRDMSPQVRLQAAAGLSSRKGLRSSVTLIKALDEEQDAEVQYALLAALGKVGTPDAVQTLIRAAEPEGRFFRKKPVTYRVAAIQALGVARTSAALAALQTLVNDKEKEVRDAVFRVMVQAQAVAG